MLKYCALFSLCAGVTLAADFMTGQAARLVIGQVNFTQQDPLPCLPTDANSGNCASATLLGGVGGIAYAPGADTLIVTDANRIGLTPINHRVLMYHNLSKMLPAPTASFDVGPRCPVCGGTADTVLGQTDFTGVNYTSPPTQHGFRLPTAVASDGHYLVVADTSNNRVLIWNSIPSSSGQNADVVVGQKDFVSVKPVTVDATSVRAPQGVWIQGTRLYVADTLNNRVLVWRNIPTTNNQPADIVLGQPNFTTVPQIDLSKATLDAQANTMLNPVSVTSDGTHLFVTDLGHNRVLVWKTIPDQNQQPADVEIGQPDFVSAIANNAFTGSPATTTTDTTNKETPVLCTTPRTDNDPAGNPTYPLRCEKTLNFPRFALSDGTRLFVADGGNDRILIFNQIPGANGASADVVLGQIDFTSTTITSTEDLFHPNLSRSAANVTPTPMALAWDGTNLYVTDPTSRRILVFTPSLNNIPINGVRNAASREIFAFGTIGIALNTAQANDTITISINTKNYVYKVVKDDTVDTIVKAITDLINAGSGDPNVLATSTAGTGIIALKARKSGADGNNISISSAVTPSTAMVAASTSGTTLQGGEDATTLAPGTFITLFGTNLADVPDAGVAGNMSGNTLPRDLGGVQVYFDGIRSPVTFVSPTQINAQIPYEVSDSNSSSAVVRTVRKDGSITVTTAVAVPIAPQNPGIFAEESTLDLRPALAYHSSSFATGTISVDGSVTAGDTGTINIEDRPYSYTVQATDTLQSIRDAFISLINANPEERVVASAAGAFARIRLRAKVAGPEGDGIAFSVAVSNNASLSLGPTNPTLCCANIAGARITPANPALPGETIYVFATGLGVVKPDEARLATVTGARYFGPTPNDPNSFVSSLLGGSTANVITAGLALGTIDLYQVFLELNGGLAADNNAQLTISQDIYTSNIVTLAVGNPAGAAPATATPSQ
jgi:uncharacterized protein (TIGR03437 family)